MRGRTEPMALPAVVDYVLLAPRTGKEAPKSATNRNLERQGPFRRGRAKSGSEGPL